MSQPHSSADIDPQILSTIARIDDAVEQAKAVMNQLVREHQANLRAGKSHATLPSGQTGRSEPAEINNGYFFDIRFRAATLREKVEDWLRRMALHNEGLDQESNRRVYNQNFDETERIILDANALIEYANTGAIFDELAFARMDEACKQLTFRLGLSKEWPDPALCIRLVHKRFPPIYQSAITEYQTFNGQYSHEVSAFHASLRPYLKQKLKELEGIDIVGYTAAARRAKCLGICANIGICINYGCCVGTEVLWPEQYWRQNVQSPSTLQRWWWRTRGKTRGSC